MVHITLKNKAELATLISSSEVLKEFFDGFDAPDDCMYPCQLPMPDALCQKDLDLYYSLIVNPTGVAEINDDVHVVIKLSRFFKSRQLLVNAEPYILPENPAYFLFGVSLSKEVFERLGGFLIPTGPTRIRNFIERFIMIKDTKITKYWFWPVTTDRMGRAISEVYGKSFVSTEHFKIQINATYQCHTQNGVSEVGLWVETNRKYFPNSHIELKHVETDGYIRSSTINIVSGYNLLYMETTVFKLITTILKPPPFVWELLPLLDGANIKNIGIITLPDGHVDNILLDYREFVEIQKYI